MRYRHFYSASFRIRLIAVSQYQPFIPFFRLCAVMNSSNSQVRGRRAQNASDLLGVYRPFYSSMGLRAVGLLRAYLNSTSAKPGLQFIRIIVSDSVNVFRHEVYARYKTTSECRNDSTRYSTRTRRCSY